MPCIGEFSFIVHYILASAIFIGVCVSSAQHVLRVPGMHIAPLKMSPAGFNVIFITAGRKVKIPDGKINFPPRRYKNNCFES